MLKWNWLLTAALVLALGGCGVTASGPTTSDGDIAKLSAGGTGIVLLHLTVKDDSAKQLTAVIARRPSSGSYKQMGAIVTRFPNDPPNVSGQRTLDAGEYAIIEVNALFSGVSTYSAVAKSTEGLDYVYTRPIATFRVGAGEVVDLGTLRITETSAGTFSAASGPMPAAALQELATRNSHLHKARVARPLQVVASSGVWRSDFSGTSVTTTTIRR